MSVLHTEPTRRNGDRTVKLTWELGTVTDDEGETMTATAQLSVSHDANRKTFLVSISRVNTSRERGFLVEKFALTTGTRVRLAGYPVSRYSVKALDAAAASALAEVRARANDPELVAVADPTSPA